MRQYLIFAFLFCVSACIHVLDLGIAKQKLTLDATLEGKWHEDGGPSLLEIIREDDVHVAHNLTQKTEEPIYFKELILDNHCRFLVTKEDNMLGGDLARYQFENNNVRFYNLIKNDRLGKILAEKKLTGFVLNGAIAKLDEAGLVSLVALCELDVWEAGTVYRRFN